MSQLNVYESLPELLADLKIIAVGVSSSDDQPQKLGWTATIESGGNYHLLRFVTNNADYYRGAICRDPVKEEDRSNFEGYPDFESLNAELNHIREFITDKTLAKTVTMHYDVSASNSRPNLRVYLNGTNAELKCYDCPYTDLVEERTPPNIFQRFGRYIRDSHEIRLSLTLMAVLPVASVASAVLVKRLME